MNERVRMIVEQARQLSPEERREMFDWLDVEFATERSDGTPEEIERAWLEEIRRRIDQSERGETTPIDLEEALARARALIR
jgi:hypothetical protein